MDGPVGSVASKYKNSLDAAAIELDYATDREWDLFNQFGLEATPSVVITKANGTVYDTIVGAGTDNEKKIKEDLKKLIGW